METIETFYQELAQIVARRASSSHLVDVLAFTEEISERLQEDPVFGEYRQAEHQDRLGRSSFKIHGYTELDEADGSIGLIVSKWSDEETPQTLTNADITQMTGWLQTFASGAIDNQLASKIVPSNDAYELASVLQNSRNRISRIRFHIFSNCTLSQRFKEEICGDISGIPIERHIWDLVRIKSLYESSREREAIEIHLSDFKSAGISCIKASEAEGLRSYLCVIDANLLADLFERYGSRLLEGNVRSFLGMKGGVNKGIRSTIQDAPGRFFAYNNGIAATASGLNIATTNQGSVITSVTDLQIVNGGQTTASILSARKKDNLSLAGVAVQMKLTEVKSDVGNQMIPLIAKYANTQNKIAVADFFANHPVHRKLEEISRRLRTPAKAGARIESKWFYERSRGQYQNERLYLAKTKRDIFDIEYPSSQLINKTDLAKYDSAWNSKPWWIAQGAQKNFTRFAGQFSPPNDNVTESDYWDSLSPKFGEAYYQNMISIAIIWKHVESMISDGRGDWYEGDYRSRITAYTVTQFFQIYKNKGGGFDLQKIWASQSVPNELNNALIELAIKVQFAILHPPQGTTDVGEWTKKEDCWNKIRELSINWDATLAEYFVGNSALKLRAQETRKAGELDDSISIQKRVLDMVTSGYWLALYKWPKSAESFTPGEMNLLSKASTLNGFMKLALEKDWRKLLEIAESAHSDGFRHT
jgi:AIPR protein